MLLMRFIHKRCDLVSNMFKQIRIMLEFTLPPFCFQLSSLPLCMLYIQVKSRYHWMYIVIVFVNIGA